MVYLIQQQLFENEDLRSNTPPGGFGISKLVRSRSSISSCVELLSFSLILLQATGHHPSLHTVDQLDHDDPPKTQLSPQKFLSDANFLFSLSLCRSRRRSVERSVHPRPGCRTLAGTVAGRQGVTVRSTAGHRGRRAGTGTARDSAPARLSWPLS